MKKTLALVLALAMVFSTVTVAFAEETAAIGADAQVCADLGMLKGATGTVDAAYLATTPTRLQAAIMFLRLKGLEAEATGFTGTDNFADADKVAWAEGKAILAYLKAYPELGWKGDGTNFDPNSPVTAQQYYKVMLEALGYKQNTAEVVGDFTWENVLAFAAEKGLTKVAAVTNFTVNDVATATVEALKAKVKGVDKTLVDSLVEAGKVDKAKAVAAGLVVEKVEVAAAVDSAEALGNTVVEVAFDADVDAAAAGDASNYTIEGLEVKGVTVTGSDTVRLETAAMTAGKLYKLTVGEKTVTFTGVPKSSTAPTILDSKSEDVDEVEITFDRNLDYAAATNVANYTINGVEVVEAAVDGDTVTLTTEGLKNKTSYVVKVTNMKSIDGVTRKSDSDDFKSNFDVAAPKIEGEVSVRTNQRIKVTFNEEVTKESAEDLANYSIKVNETDGAELEIVSVTWDSDGEDNVTIITEPMEKKVEYKLTVNNIADQRKVPNVMTRSSSKLFKGLAADEDAPEFREAVTLSPTSFTVEFRDDSMLDEASVLDVSNYTLEEDNAGLDIESIDKVSSGWVAADEEYKYVALFTVEEMPDKADVELTFIDILDEFGNAVDEDVTVDISTNKDNYASAELLHAYVRDENTVELIFNKELDEASAENIAYYTLDGGIGSPRKAEYEADGAADNSVTLTVNDLVDGKTYDVTVDGVKDLAGHTLKIVDFDTSFESVDDHWDNDAPVLEDIDVLNKYVIALTFDEEVSFGDLTDVRLVINELPGIDFVAKATAEDDTVVEFSYYDPDWAGLTSETYTVSKVVYGGGAVEGGITDNNNNAFILGDDEVISGVDDDDDPDYAEFGKYNQVGGTFEVTMSKDVKLVGDADELTVEAEDANGRGIGDFTVTTDGDTVYFDGDIVEDVDYYFDLSAFLVDMHDMPVVNDDVDEDEGINETVLTGEETDKEAPVIEDVYATCRKTIKVEFSEYVKLLDDDKFTLKNVDLNKNVAIADVTVDAHDNVVTLTLTDANALEGRYEYELTMAASAVEDYAGNDVKADTFTFDGSDLAQD